MKKTFISVKPVVLALFALTAIVAIDIFVEQTGITGAVVIDAVEKNPNLIFLPIFAFIIGTCLWLYQKH